MASRHALPFSRAMIRAHVSTSAVMISKARRSTSARWRGAIADHAGSASWAAPTAARPSSTPASPICARPVMEAGSLTAMVRGVVIHSPAISRPVGVSRAVMSEGYSRTYSGGRAPDNRAPDNRAPERTTSDCRGMRHHSYWLLPHGGSGPCRHGRRRGSRQHRRHHSAAGRCCTVAGRQSGDVAHRRCHDRCRPRGQGTPRPAPTGEHPQNAARPCRHAVALP